MGEAAALRPSIAAERENAPAEAVAPSFPDLVWAHWQWDVQRQDGAVDPQVEQHYHRTRDAFEAEHGRLVSVYWSRTDASAVGVTVKPRGRLSFGDADIEFHRVTDWVTRDVPGIPEELDHCETLATKVREVLRSTSERIAIEWIFAVASHLLGFIERADGRPSDRDARQVAQDAERELRKIESYYHRAGAKSGRIVYAQGMLLGVIALVAVGFVGAGILWLFGAYDAHSPDIQRFFACYAAGALGGIVSVMSRLSSEKNKIQVDYEVGRYNLWLLGAFRPFVGAIFGLALYFAVRGGLLQLTPKEESSFYWYTALSFLAGFSERFTEVLIDNAEQGAEAGMRPEPARTRPAPRPSHTPPPKREEQTAPEP